MDYGRILGHEFAQSEESGIAESQRNNRNDMKSCPFGGDTAAVAPRPEGPVVVQYEIPYYRKFYGQRGRIVLVHAERQEEAEKNYIHRQAGRTYYPEFYEGITLQEGVFTKNCGCCPWAGRLGCYKHAVEMSS